MFVQANLGVQQGWRVDRHPRLAANLGPNAVGVVGFGDTGVWSAVGDGQSGFPTTNLVKLSFAYGTIVLALVANDRAVNSRGLWRSTDWNGTNFGQFVGDRLRSRLRLALTNHHAFAVENANMRLVHRDIDQQNSPSNDLFFRTDADPIDLSGRLPHITQCSKTP